MVKTDIALAPDNFLLLGMTQDVSLFDLFFELSCNTSLLVSLSHPCFLLKTVTVNFSSPCVLQYLFLNYLFFFLLVDYSHLQK